MNITIVIVLLVLLGAFVVSMMRARRKAWEEHERQRKERAAAREREEEALRKAMAAQLVATMQLPSILAVQQAQAKALAADRAAKAAQQQAADQNLMNRRQFDAARAESRIQYNPMKDQYEDQHGNVVPEPNGASKQDRAYFNPDAFGTRLLRPEAVARISTAEPDDEAEQQRRRRHDAVEAAMLDAQLSGLGVVRIHSSGAMEHVPESTFRGGGGSFDGGGASGDYTPAASSCTSSSSSDSGSSSSCSSSDSGGSSSSD